MRLLKFFLAGVILAAPVASHCAGFDLWQIDRSHSTARLSLAASNHASQPFDLAVAMVAGTLDFNPSKPADSVANLTIYPADQASLLLTAAGGFRTGTLAPLSRYSVLEFHSKRSFVAPDGKLAIVGDLTLVHVRRRINVDWSDSYTGPVYDDADQTRITREVTFSFDNPASLHASGQGGGAVEILGSSVIDRANFSGLWSALRDSEWPHVVLDEACRTPYYPGPGLKDYKGSTCTGLPVNVAPRESPQITAPGLEAIGTVVPVPPAGDQVVIQVHLQMKREGSGSTGKVSN